MEVTLVLCGWGAAEYGSDCKASELVKDMVWIWSALQVLLPWL
jgi:hypothetical protein